MSSRARGSGFPLNFILSVEGATSAAQQLKQFSREIEKINRVSVGGGTANTAGIQGIAKAFEKLPIQAQNATTKTAQSFSRLNPAIQQVVTKIQSTLQKLGSMTPIDIGNKIVSEFQKLRQVHPIVDSLANKIRSGFTSISGNTQVQAFVQKVNTEFQKLRQAHPVLDALVMKVRQSMSVLSSTTLGNMGQKIASSLTSGFNTLTTNANKVKAAITDALSKYSVSTGGIERIKNALHSVISSANQAKHAVSSVGAVSTIPRTGGGGMGISGQGFASGIRSTMGFGLSLGMLSMAQGEATFMKESVRSQEEIVEKLKERLRLMKEGKQVEIDTEKIEDATAKLEIANQALKEFYETNKSNAMYGDIGGGKLGVVGYMPGGQNMEKRAQELRLIQQQKKAQEEYNEAIGAPTPKAIQDVSAELQKQTRYLEQLSRMEKQATADATYFKLLIGTEMVSAFAGMATAATGAFGRFGRGAADAEVPVGRLQKAFGGFGGILRTLGRSFLMVSLPLAAIGIAAAAVSTNFLGFRDALNGIGKTIGDLIPPLRPLLNLIQGLGAMMGMTGNDVKDGAGQVNKAFADMRAGAMAAFDKIKWVWSDLSESFSKGDIAGALQKSAFYVKEAIGNIYTSLTGNDFQSAVDTFKQNMKTTFDIFKSGDILGAVDFFAHSVASIFNLDQAYVNFKTTLGKMGELLKAGDIIGAAQTAGDAIWKALTGSSTGIDWKGITDGLRAMAQAMWSWIQANGPGIAQGIGNALWAALQGLGGWLAQQDWNGIGKAAWSVVVGMWNYLVTNAPQVANWIGTALWQGLSQLGSWLASLNWTGMGQTIWNLVSALGNYLMQNAPGVANVIGTALWQGLVQLGSWLANLDWNAIANGLWNLVKAFGQWAIQNAPGIANTIGSTLWQGLVQLGTWLAGKDWNGIANSLWNMVRAFGSWMVQNAPGIAQTIGTTLWQGLSQLGQWLASQDWNSIANALWNMIKAFGVWLATNTGTIANTIASGIWQGILGIGTWLATQDYSAIATALLNGIKDAILNAPNTLYNAILTALGVPTEQAQNKGAETGMDFKTGAQNELTTNPIKTDGAIDISSATTMGANYGKMFRTAAQAQLAGMTTAPIPGQIPGPPPMAPSPGSYRPPPKAGPYGPETPGGGPLPGHAKGFEGWVTSPYKFVAGEDGPEYVRVIPKGEMTKGKSSFLDTMSSSLTSSGNSDGRVNNLESKMDMLISEVRTLINITRNQRFPNKIEADGQKIADITSDKLANAYNRY